MISKLSFLGCKGYKNSSLFLVLISAIFSPIHLNADVEKANRLIEKVDLKKASLDELVMIKDLYTSDFDKKPSASLEGLGRLAYLKGYLIHSKLPKDSKLFFQECLTKAQSEVKPLTQDYIQSLYTWGPTCLIYWFNIADTKFEKGSILKLASDYVKELIVTDQGERWLALRSHIKANNSDWQLQHEYFGGAMYRVLAATYAKIEEYFVKNDVEFLEPLKLVLKDIIGGTSDQHIIKFRKQLCLRSREFYKASLEVESTNNILDRTGSEFLSNYRIGADVERVCGDINKAKDLLKKAQAVFKDLKDEDLIISEDDAELELITSMLKGLK